MLSLRERDFEAFFEAPFRAYGEESLYVSPFKTDLKRFLDPKANPLFKGGDNFTYFTAHNDRGVPVGRIVAHIHRESNARFHWKQGYFGFFDVIESREATQLLLDAAEKWNRAQGMTEIIGNFNFTAMQMAGVVTAGFEHEPYGDNVWNPAYTPKLLEQHGYTATFPMNAMIADLTQADPNGFRDCSLDPARLTWRHFRKSRFKEDLEQARLLLNAGFDKNPMFVPQTWDEIYFQAKDLSYVIDEKITTFVDVDGEPAGVSLMIPDIAPLLKALRSELSWRAPWEYLKFRLTNDRAVAIFISVKPEHHNCGLVSGLLKRTLLQMQSAGYKRLGMTWISDENTPSLKSAARMGGKPAFRLHLFRKDL